jgi:hypothetical protein
MSDMYGRLHFGQDTLLMYIHVIVLVAVIIVRLVEVVFRIGKQCT